MPPKKVKAKVQTSFVDQQRFDDIFKDFKPNENIEISPEDGWVLPNRIKFSQWVKTTFNYSKKQQTRLFASQRFVKDFIQYDSPYRGIFLYHGLGLGKSLASIVSAENLIGKMDVVVMLPASLRTNYVDEIKKGTNSFFSIHQHWKFISTSSFNQIIDTVSKAVFVNRAYIVKKGGVWIPLKTGASNWDTLNNDHKDQINKQLDVMINTKYTFINYNGVRSDKKVAELKANGNPFENKVVIVDEVHNFISSTVGSGKYGKIMYEMLLMAKNAKLILLSGTPIINYPFEVAFLINLLKGPQYVHHLTNIQNFDIGVLTSYLENNAYIDMFNIDTIKKTVSVQLAPPNFVFTNKAQYLLKRDNDRPSDEEVLKDISQSLLCKVMPKPKPAFVFPLAAGVPDNKAYPKTAIEEIRHAFNSKYVDLDVETVTNPRMLARRMSGCVSYFATFFGDVYPDRLPTELVMLNMSDYQFGVYEKNRAFERVLEERAKNKAKKRRFDDTSVFKKSGEVYRAYSRANCNFVFPEEVPRPKPNKMGLIKKEIASFNDVPGDEDATDPADGVVADQANTKNTDDKGEDDYHKRVNTALQKIEQHGDKFLSIQGLQSLSPKYAVLVPKLTSCKGKALVYSEYRTVEGLRIISMALDANGWAEFKIRKNPTTREYVVDIKPEDRDKPKYFQFRGNDEDTKVLMKIYNNDTNDLPTSIKSYITSLKRDNLHGDIIKLIMITESGAEGISLKHVREVHVVEPYWNEIRIEQVIGRAIRANSHVDLPKSERNVRVYRYLVKMTPQQLKSDKTIQNKDRSMTSDQHVYDVAQRKANIVNQVQDLMKSAAVDCLVHAQANGVKCLEFPKNANPNDLAYQLDYNNEESDVDFRQKVRTTKVKMLCKRCAIGSTEYAYDPQTHILYDLLAYKEGKMVKVGKLELNKDTGKYKVIGV